MAERQQVQLASDRPTATAPGTAPLRRLARLLGNLLRAEGVNVLLTTIGALVYAAAFDLFLAPSHVAPGGLGGVALVITHYVSLPNGMVLFVLNIPLLLLGAWQLGGVGFMGRTIYAVVATVIAIDAFAPLVPAHGASADPLLNALYGGAVTGIAGGLVIRAHGNLGGTGILGRVLQRRTGIPMGQVYMVTDGVIVALMGAVFGWERALYSLVALFISGLATDYAIEGPSIVRTVFIVTDRPEEVAAALQARLRTGVTAWKGEGMYSRGERTVLFCTVNRTEVREVTRVVRETDHHGFLVVGQGHKALGGTIGKSDRAG
ncbi:MAG TPA: YitT family protein [Trueperaceae bacterium]|nr:YitT family protein [Trueperaceae bacterium]